VFDRILFEIHVALGLTAFGDRGITTPYWSSIKGRYNRLVSANARIYFIGCNVAEGSKGWDFLESVANVFMTSGGGVIFGQTSAGFGNPYNGHLVHFWGKTRTVKVDASGGTTRFES
jgi:hypothetical protein